MSKRLTPYAHSEWTPASVKAKVRGGALATQASRNEALQSQSRILAQGCRVVASVGLTGQETFFCADSGVDPVDSNSGNPGSATQKYPHPNSVRVMDRRKVRLTPGYRLAVKAVFAKSGPTHYQLVEPGGQWYEGKLIALLTVKVTYTKGGVSEIASHVFAPHWGVAPFKGLVGGPGGAWGDLIEQDAVLQYYSDWTEGVSAEIEIVGGGGVRPVEICVYEVPYAGLYSETAREGTCSSFNGSSEYAISGQSFPFNALNGSVQASKTARDQSRIWGPVLFAWSCWDESANLLTVTEGTPPSITSTTYRSLKTPSVVGYATTNPGHTMASGGYARHQAMSGDLELRGKVGVIPVLIRVYARMSAVGPTGTVRFQTAPHSLRDITVTGTTYVWRETFAWLECSVHASVPSTLQVLAKVTSGSLEVRYVSVEYYPNYEVVE